MKTTRGKIIAGWTIGGLLVGGPIAWLLSNLLTHEPGPIHKWTAVFFVGLVALKLAWKLIVVFVDGETPV